MLDHHHLHQGAGFIQLLDHGLVGLGSFHPLKLQPFGGEDPLVVQRREHRQTIFLADNKVVDTVAGCRMHAAGARFQGDMLA